MVGLSEGEADGLNVGEVVGLSEQDPVYPIDEVAEAIVPK